ncbi:putative integral membrane protein [Brugia pahangi]
MYKYTPKKWLKNKTRQMNKSLVLFLGISYSYIKWTLCCLNLFYPGYIIVIIITTLRLHGFIRHFKYFFRPCYYFIIS